MQKLLQELDLRVKQIPFSMKEKLEEGGYTEEEKIVVKLHDEFSMKIEDLSLMGTHNVANSLAASIAGKILNISNESIRNSLTTFQAVEHNIRRCGRN